MSDSWAYVVEVKFKSAQTAAKFYALLHRKHNSKTDMDGELAERWEDCIAGLERLKSSMKGKCAVGVEFAAFPGDGWDEEFTNLISESYAHSRVVEIRLLDGIFFNAEFTVNGEEVNLSKEPLIAQRLGEYEVLSSEESTTDKALAKFADSAIDDIIRKLMV